MLAQPEIARRKNNNTREGLKQIFEAYISYCEYTVRLRPETIRGYRQVFQRFTDVMPEIKEPGALSGQVMNEFFKRLETRKRIVGRDTEKIGVKDSTIRTYWSKLNSFFEWLLANKIILENPLLKNKPLEPVYADLPALKKEEIEKIYAAITLHSKDSLMLRRDTAMVSTLLFMGLRKTEFISLNVSDVDMQKGILVVRGATSKSKKTRILPIHPTALVHLKDYFKERQAYRTEKLFVSSNEDVGLSVHGLKHWVKRLNELSGVRFHLHQFRHTFACALAREDINTKKLQTLMGHTDLRMTDRYLRSLGVADLVDDVNKISIDKLR